MILTALAIWMGSATTGHAVRPDLKDVIYTPEDSAHVVNLLRTEVKGTSDVLFFARRFLGRPYVAHTLEVAAPERLVVNLRELDCTTLVETVLALTLTKRQKSDKFTDFCQNLERLRYFGGRRNGYLSRLHYFTWWMHDNIDKGIMEEVTDPKYFTSPIIVKNHYMSRHASAYKMLRTHPEWIDSIAALERRFNGPDRYFLPESRTALGRKALSTIQDGDLIAIVTTKDGLDYSHLGFAVWGKDDRLHLLNASSIYHRVVEDQNTLHRYLARQKSAIGIRLLRLAE